MKWLIGKPFRSAQVVMGSFDHGQVSGLKMCYGLLLCDVLWRSLMVVKKC